MSAPREISRRWRALFLVTALGMFLAAPWLAMWPPGVDFAQHTALAGYLNHLFLAKTGAVDQSILCLSPFGPYHLYHWLTALFLRALPEWAATCAVISLAGLLWLWAVDAYGLAAKASGWWVLLAAPLFYGLTYAWGMGPNLLGFFTVPLAMALTLRFAETGGVALALRLFAVLILSALIHPWPFAMALVSCGLLLVHALFTNQRRLLGLLPGLVALLAPPGLAAFYYGVMAARKSTEYAVDVPTPGLLEKIGLLPHYAAGVFSVGNLETHLSTLLISGLVLTAFGRFRAVDWTGREIGFALVALLLFIPYLVLPEGMLTMYNVFGRTAPFAILGLALLDGQRQTRLARLGRRLALFAAFALLAVNLVFHSIFGQQVRGLDRIVPAIPAGASHLGVIYSTERDFTRLAAANHLHAYLAARSGGAFSYSFTHQHKMPVTDCDPQRQDQSAELDGHPELFRPERHLPQADFILLRWPFPSAPLPAPVAAAVQSGTMTASEQAGSWFLFRVERKRGD